jgi:hypothetical protein
MKRIIIACLILGFIVPFMLFIGQYVLLRSDPERVSQFRAVWYYVWPSAVFLMAAPGGKPADAVLILCVAVIANMLAYGVMGTIVALCWRVGRRLWG